VEATGFEEFQYVAAQTYEQRTGEELPDTGVSSASEPVGEQWSEDGDDLQRLLPKLWAKYEQS
jgi:hypothetical protein